MMSATRSRSGANRTLLDTALRAELARTVAVRQQHRIARLQQVLGPIAIARLDRLGIAAEPAAAVQRDHGGKRAITGGLVKLRVQHPVAKRNVDLMRGRQRRGADAKVTAKSVRNIWPTKGASGSPGRDGVGRKALHISGYHVPIAAIHHKSVGLQGGHLTYL